MSADMQFEALGNYVTLLSGNTPSKAKSSYWEGSIPWVSAKDMGDFWINDSIDHLTEEGLQVASRLVPAGSVLILTRGMTLHKRVPICRTAKPTTFNQDVKAVLPRTGLSSRFLPYLLVGNHDKLHQKVDSAGHGTGRLNTEALLSFPVWVPPLTLQERIADIGEALDDRITLLHETNKNLEAIAQAIFKSWFVDFDPVRAKMEGRQPEGMDEATAALFPDSFEESELGLVPKGWRVQQLDQIAEYLNGLALQKHPPTGINDLPVIKIAQLRKGDTLGSDKASREIKPEYIIQDGDVLFSWSGSLEVEVWCGGEGALNQHLFKVTSRTFPKWLYLYATKLFLCEFRKIAESKATTMGHIQRRHLSDAKLALPDNVLISKLSEVFEPLLDRYISNSLQARTLVSIRDALLPRLISGQLRLPEAQEQIENALT